MSALLFFFILIFRSAFMACVLFFLFLFIYLNYTMYIIAKSKGKGGRITTTHGHQETNGQKLNLKQISTCSMAIGCFVICSSPTIVGFILYLISDALLNDRSDKLFHIWLSTLFAMNSTFNCLIFFWENSVLRREGIKAVKCFQSARS